MKPRVAIALPYFGNGGAENMVSRLAAHLDLSKVDAEVICIYGQPLHNRLENAVTSHGVPIKFIGKGKGFSVGAMRKLWKELSDFKATVVHTHLSACVYCAPWVLLHKVKMLHTVHNTPMYELIKPKQIVMALMYKLRKAIPAAISHEIQHMMSAHYCISSEIDVVYNPVDIKKYNIKKIPHQGISVVTVGRLSKQKNQKLLIDAISKVSQSYQDVCLTVLGDGPLRNDLKKYIKTKSLEKVVRILGNVDNVEDYFAKADVFVLSSTYEGLPLVILEAMAAHLPIVSTKVGGVKDIVTNNGILVKPENEDELAEGIRYLIENAEIREEMGRNSYQNVQQFDSAVIACQYIELYNRYSA